MHLLITGSRTLNEKHYELLKKMVKKHYPNTSAIWTGGAKGCDTLGKKLAMELGLNYAELHPNYARYGRNYAPLQRNAELVQLTEATMGVCYGMITNGTMHTLEASRKAKHPTMLINAQNEAEHQLH